MGLALGPGRWYGAGHEIAQCEADRAAEPRLVPLHSRNRLIQIRASHANHPGD
jgi:hypothetical protein